jgi:repressor LexA
VIKITTRQREILDTIVALTAQRGFPPTAREIGAVLGLTSSSTIHRHLEILQMRGYIKRSPRSPRAICVVRTA